MVRRSDLVGGSCLVVELEVVVLEHTQHAGVREPAGMCDEEGGVIPRDLDKARAVAVVPDVGHQFVGRHVVPVGREAWGKRGDEIQKVAGALADQRSTQCGGIEPAGRTRGWGSVEGKRPRCKQDGCHCCPNIRQGMEGT